MATRRRKTLPRKWEEKILLDYDRPSHGRPYPVYTGVGSAQPFVTETGGSGLTPMSAQYHVSHTEICHGADDLEHQAPRWSTEIEVVAKADKGHSVGTKVREGIDQMFQRTPKAIDLPNQHGIELPSVSVGHQLVELRSRFF